MAVLLMLSARCFAFGGARPATVTPYWNEPVREFRTQATLQVVVNPLLRRDSKIHDKAWDALGTLAGAENIRFVPWFPYPRLSIFELEPGRWDSRLIDPLVEDFLAHQPGREPVMNFSVLPHWLFCDAGKVEYPSDPNQVSWENPGTRLCDPTLGQARSYFKRVFEWYTRGGFTDEAGRRHASDYRYAFPWWEVLNETDFEHPLPIKDYIRLYDGIASELRATAPATRFIGLAYAEPANHLADIAAFLDPGNHVPAKPVDGISFHFYARADQSTPASGRAARFFAQVDAFTETARRIVETRDRVSPSTRIFVNEVGTLLETDFLPFNKKTDPRRQKDYWRLSFAVFADVFIHLAQLGVESVGESQLVGNPGQFPSVSMLDWESGRPNARLEELRALLRDFSPGAGAKSVRIVSSDPEVSALAVSDRRRRRILLVNRSDAARSVTIPNANGGGGTQVRLEPFAVRTVQAGVSR